MKHYNKNLLFALIAVLAVSCADAPFAEYKTEKPESLKKYEYLNEYDALKTYIDRTTHPNFKLGTGVTVSDFLKEDLVYTLVSNNYDELTPGNAMKYSSCVDKNGNMDFGTVKKFVKTAKEAGLSIYGHTLCWHSQQQNDYLNGLIADREIVVDPDAANNFIKYTCGEAAANSWDKQGIYTLPAALEKDANYTLKVDIKASAAGKCGLWPIWDASSNKNQWGGSNDVQYLEEKDVTTDWATYEWTFVASFTHDKLQFTFGKQGGAISFDNFVLVKQGTENNLIDNGDFAKKSTTGWASVGSTLEVTAEAQVTTIPVAVLEDDFSTGTAMPLGWGNSSTCMVVDGVHQMTNPSVVNSWEAQAGYDFSAPLTEGTTYFLKMKIKGSVAGSIAAAFQKPEGYAGRGDFSSIPVTTEWKEITVSTKCTGDATTRFLFNYGKYAGTIYIDDLSIYWEKSANSIPIPDEEKKEILTNELDRWIKGMMEACGGYVKAWDVVNEPISGKDSDGDGFYNLQSAKLTDDNGVAGENFYWQDYLGDDYARIPIALARKYFAEYGGNPDDLKLFINDYNLESDWDAVPNQKLKSLIHYIERWESDGVTKVDGIGTQMHVSYHMNPTTQTSKENAIVNMFTLLASTGKLIKITELDMGVVDVDGKTAILTENLTDEMQQKMSEFYQFIIEKYFEIIPVAQQYGITHWSPTDSPAESSWRKGQPIGLWDLNYNRKPVYVGFLEGLKNGTQGKTAVK